MVYSDSFVPDFLLRSRLVRAWIWLGSFGCGISRITPCSPLVKVWSILLCMLGHWLKCAGSFAPYFRTALTDNISVPVTLLNTLRGIRFFNFCDVEFSIKKIVVRFIAHKCNTPVALILLNHHQIGFSVSVRKSERIAPYRYVSIQEIRGGRGFDSRQIQTIGYLVIFRSTWPFRSTLRKKIYTSIEELQTDLDQWLIKYNTQRTHQGKMCCGSTPMETLIDGKSIWKEKFLN